MSLRYRLFLWISGLFVVVSLCAYFSENYLTQRELTKARVALRQEILDNSEKKRVDLQNFLTSSIVEKLVALDAILSNISNFSPQALRFGPITHNEKKGTWGDAVDLLLEDKWVDFIQNTNQGKVTAGVLLQQDGMNSAFKIPIDEDLAWEFVGEDPKPYLAVRVPYSLVVPSVAPEDLIRQVHGVVPLAYVLFDVAELADPSKTESLPLFTEEKPFPPIPVKWTEGYELDVEPFVKALRRGRELLVTKKITPPTLSKEELREKRDGGAALENSLLNVAPNRLSALPISQEGLMRQKIEEAALHYTQISMIWVLVALFEDGLFGDDLFVFPSPAAVTVFSGENKGGIGLETRDVLFSSKVFEDAAYYQSYPPKEGDGSLASSLAVIPSLQTNQVFFGNTTELQVETPQGMRTGYLTLGVDADSLLQRLSLAIQHTVMLVYDDHLFGAFGEGGERMPSNACATFPFTQMGKENSGLISWEGKSYYYMRIQPFSHLPLNFFLLNPEEKEFALLRNLDAGAQRVVDSIRLNTHLSGFVALLIAILLIHNIARNITRPIVQLASATKDIAEGNLEKVRQSLPPAKHKDEIAVLCHSFDEMVRGLQDRAKVKGVLNKVVSQEIAQEILQGTIHLGGEEKRVSVLFADIRGFTAMTQAMPAKEVIELLNTCMTKVSLSIDHNKGVIDKYVGDEAMALFGAPLSRSEDALNAIKSALEMIEEMKRWNEERQTRGEPLIELGIGIHTGPMLAGNMGAENRLNYTVIGSNVNLASRVCSAAKKMEILVTRDTLEEPFVKEHIEWEALSPMQLKGFDNPVEIFRIIGWKR
jgi:class 3 adenylate cyclase